MDLNSFPPPPLLRTCDAIMARFLHTLTPGQKKEDDDYFPLSASVQRCVENGTIHPLQAKHLDPPFQTVANLYYPERGESTIRASSSRIANAAGSHKKIHLAPLHFRNQAVWKNFTPCDHEYSKGFRDFVPSTFTQNFNWDHVQLLTHPAWEKTTYNDSPELVDEHDLPPSPSQNNAREFLAQDEECRVKYSGCGETQNLRYPSVFCCTQTNRHAHNRNAEMRRKHEFSLVHSRPICPANRCLHSSINNLDLNAKNAQNHALRHFFVIRPVPPNELENQLQFIFDREGKRLPFQWHKSQHTEDRIGELEVGFLEPDSSLQMSLSADRWKSVNAHPHPFLRDSPLYKDHLKEFADNGGAPLGPPIGNPSQNMLMGRWVRKQTEANVWQNRQPTPRALNDPRKAKRRKGRWG